MNAMLEAAQRYTALGLHITQIHRPTADGCGCGDNACESPGKHPKSAGWKERRSSPQEWANGGSQQNIAIVTGAPSGVVVLDVDAGGEETLARLQAEHGPLPATVEQRTGSGGRHLLFKHPGVPVANSQKRLGPGLDVRGDGGYIVAAPSLHKSGNRYAWTTGAAPEDLEPAPLPAWLLELMRKPEVAPQAPRTAPATQGPDRLERARRYLARIEPAVSGSGGHAKTLLAAEHMVRGFELDQEIALDLLLNDYNPRCLPPWSGKELRHKVREAAEKGTAVQWGQHLKDAASKFGPASREATPARSREPGEDDGDPELPTAPEPLFLPVEEFFATCGKSVDYILEPYLPRDGFVIVDGAPKGGKTWFLCWLAGEIAARGKRVMFVEEEGSKETLRERLQPFLRLPAHVHVAHRRGFKLDDERSLRRLIEEIKAARADVLILDPLNQLHSHLRKIGDVPAEAIQAIQRIIRETGCAVILACHTRKGSSWDKSSNDEAQSADIAGSYAWAASADNIIQIKGVPRQDRRLGEVRFYVENPDTRNGEPFTKRLAVVRVDARGEPDAMTFDTSDSTCLRILEEILPHIPEEISEAVSVENLRKDVGKGKLVVQSGVDLGLRTGVLVRRLKGGGIYRAKTIGLTDEKSEESAQDRTSDSPHRGESGSPVGTGDHD